MGESLRGLVTGGHHALFFDHQHCATFGGAGAMFDAARHGVTLVLIECDGSLAIRVAHVDEQLAFEHAEQLVLFVVVMPVKFAFKQAQTHDRIVDGRERLIKSWLIVRDLARHIDELQVPVLVVRADVVACVGHPRLVSEVDRVATVVARARPRSTGAAHVA